MTKNAHGFLIPKKYRIIRDENQETIPEEPEYERPISVNAFTLVSEHRQPKRVTLVDQGKPNLLDDYLAIAYSSALA